MVINGAECSMCIVGAAEGAGWWQHIIRIVIVRRVWLVLSRVWIVWLVWGRVWIVWLVWGRVWVVRGRVPLRVFWSFAASHFTSLQRINLYRIYIHQEWAAAVWAAHYFTSVKMQQCCIEGDMQESHVFWCVPTPSPPPSWEHLIKVSKLEQQESHTRRKHCVPCKSNQLQSIDSDLVCFLQGLMRISQFGFGRPNSSCGLTPLTVWVLWVLPLESEENCKFLRLCTIMWYCKYGCGSLSS